MLLTLICGVPLAILMCLGVGSWIVGGDESWLVTIAVGAFASALFLGLLFGLHLGLLQVTGHSYF